MAAVPVSTNPFSDIIALQAMADASEKCRWTGHCHMDTSGEWLDDLSRPAMPSCTFQFFAKLSHGQDVSNGVMVDLANKYWSTVGFTVFAEILCKKCVICMTDNVGCGISITPASHPRPEGPFEHLMTDFIELTPCEGHNYCLVIVGVFSKCVFSKRSHVEDPQRALWPKLSCERSFQVGGCPLRSYQTMVNILQMRSFNPYQKHCRLIGEHTVPTTHSQGVM